MARALNRLSALKVARAKEPGMLADGGSLYLRIAPGGSRQWIFRYVTNGRLRDMSIGPAHTLTLAEARERATEARKLRLDGIDPIDHKRARMAALRAADARTITFRECCEAYLRSHDASWSSARHRAQWRSTLERLYPILGALPVQAIDTPLVLRALKPIWEKTPVSASRLRGRIEAVLGWATVHHYRSGDNPAKWGGLLEHALPAPGKVAKVEHHSALPYADIPEFMFKLRGNTGIAARALEFICLTAARSGEAVGVRWAEIDLDARLWTVPASRMKAGKEHRVPISAAAMAVLDQMQRIRTSDHVFRVATDKPVRGADVWRLANRLAGISVHGLRSSFRDWAAERTSFPRELAEMALATEWGARSSRLTGAATCSRSAASSWMPGPSSAASRRVAGRSYRSPCAGDGATMVAEKTENGENDWGTKLAKKFLGRRGPHEKRGRPKVLHTGKVIDPTQRALGNLLRDISEASEEIAAKNPRPQSQTDIADRLWQHKRRSYNSDRTLRRDVSRALAWTINMLKLAPPELWPKIFGIQPPSAMTKRAVLNKALEFLRMELARSRGALSSQ